MQMKHQLSILERKNIRHINKMRCVKLKFNSVYAFNFHKDNNSTVQIDYLKRKNVGYFLYISYVYAPRSQYC